MLLFYLFTFINGLSIKDKYCGENNCYTLLNLKKGASLQEIKKSFRELSKTLHPDKISE